MEKAKLTLILYNFDQKFDMDYWALTNREQLLKIMNENKKKKTKVYFLSENKFFYSLFSLKEEDRKKFNLVNNIEDAEYIITNYYIFDKNQKNKFQLLNKLEKYHDVIVDGVVVSSSFVNIKKN